MGGGVVFFGDLGEDEKERGVVAEVAGDLDFRLDFFNLIFVFVKLLFNLFLLIFIRIENQHIRILLVTEFLHDNILILGNNFRVVMNKALHCL